MGTNIYSNDKFILKKRGNLELSGNKYTIETSHKNVQQLLVNQSAAAQLIGRLGIGTEEGFPAIV